jgi:hypothetical protein
MKLAPCGDEQRRGRRVDDRARAQDHVRQIPAHPAGQVGERLVGEVAAVGELDDVRSSVAATRHERERRVRVGGHERGDGALVEDRAQDVEAVVPGHVTGCSFAWRVGGDRQSAAVTVPVLPSQ